MAVSEVFALLTLKLRLPPHYVLYEMDALEMEAILKNAEYVNQDEMEMMRLIAYVTAQVNSKTKMKVTDIVKFRWDDKIEKAVNVTADERRRLAEKAQQFKKYINVDNTDEGSDNR